MHDYNNAHDRAMNYCSIIAILMTRKLINVNVWFWFWFLNISFCSIYVALPLCPCCLMWRFEPELLFGISEDTKHPI